MKATTTLGNLIEQVETMSAGNFDETVSLTEIEFESLNEMWVENVSVEVLPKHRGFWPIDWVCRFRIWTAARLNFNRRT